LTDVRRGWRWYVLFFIGLSVIYHSNLRPIASGDSLPGSLLPFALLLDHSVTLDRFGPYLDEQVAYAPLVVPKLSSHWYSWYPIAGPVLSTPLYLPPALIPAVGQLPAGSLVSVARIAEKLTAVTWAAGSALALLFLLRRLTSERAGNWSTSSQAMWPHTFGVPMIIGCFYAIERFGETPAARWYWLAGSSRRAPWRSGRRTRHWLRLSPWVLWIQRARASAWICAFAPPIVGGGFVAAYNFSVFGNLHGGYKVRLSTHFLSGLMGELASPGRGLIIYTPIAIFAVCAFVPHARDSRIKFRLLIIAASGFAILQIAFISLWPVWWGGYCWGPRLLTEILPSLMVLIAIGLPAIQGGWRHAFAGAALYGCLIQALGAYCYPKGRWDHLPVSVDNDPSRLWNWADNPISRTARGGVALEPYEILLAAAKGGLPAAAEKLQALGINSY
jgi:hypothetical protein